MWSGTGLKLGSAERSQRVKMWGTSSPDDKLTGDLGNVIEATQIGGRRSDRLMAGKLSPGNFGLLQQYRHKADIPRRLLFCPAFGSEAERPTFSVPHAAPPPLDRQRAAPHWPADVTCWSADVTRQTVFPTSSAIRRAPVLSTASPTGRPRASPFALRNPVTTSSALPFGRPPLNGTKTTL